MSVIHFNAKELGLIASIFNEKYIPRETVLSYLETLSAENAAVYAARYSCETGVVWSVKEIGKYAKLSLTKSEKIAAYESWQSLMYNTDSSKNKTIKSILGKNILNACITSLKNSWGIE